MNSAPTVNAPSLNTRTPNWATKTPGLEKRAARALALIANVRKSGHPDVYVVDGEEGGQYLVRIHRERGTSECTCPIGGSPCAHRFAVALLETV
jgi:hypothetical protein